MARGSGPLALTRVVRTGPVPSDCRSPALASTPISAFAPSDLRNPHVPQRGHAGMRASSSSWGSRSLFLLLSQCQELGSPRSPPGWPAAPPPAPAQAQLRRESALPEHSLHASHPWKPARHCFSRPVPLTCSLARGRPPSSRPQNRMSVRPGLSQHNCPRKHMGAR